MMEAKPILYDYWRSSASYRVRIALNLIGREYEARQVDLLSAAHRDPSYLAINPQGILPSLQVGGHTLTQSLAIIEYLHATTPRSTLLPEDTLGQYRVRQLSYAIAMEIHPVCNLSVASYAAKLSGTVEEGKRAWMQHFILKGLSSFEALLAKSDGSEFCFGNQPTMADCCLVPQLYNADRWGVDYSDKTRILKVSANAKKLKAFSAAHPDSVGAP